MVVNRLMKRLGGDERVDLLRAVREADVVPYFRKMESAVAPVVRVEGRDKIMLGSNNYLGIADHPKVVEGAQYALDTFGSAVTGSRLLNGTLDLHLELEHEIAQWHNTDDALVFTTGYQTNLGTISAIVGPGDTVIVDSAAHASIRDGSALSGASVVKFKHNDMADLEAKLQQPVVDDGAVLVIVDGLYSMEGDLAPLDAVSELCIRYHAALMVDEAHSLGVYGPELTGAAELFGITKDVDVTMASLSKSPSSTGGFVTGSSDLIDTLRVKARAFLFTTSGVPAAVGAALASVRLIRSDEGKDRARRVLENAEVLRGGLQSAGLDVAGRSATPHGDTAAPIVSLHIGDDLVAMSLWKNLYDRGIFTSAALHPAVPKSGAILRLCVMATHTEQQLSTATEQIIEAVAELPR
ncbi:aminotransferase [Rhodococcus sp. 06-412-2C]|uniref:aminotransferase class I/II-fold pyridoxal phosphate-dependent enzyme n=1 Tax=unclassified Rhodococcus (in: high G+C Gram-positive bacteria) TaxID=192944 RepID=UPI000B9A610C|nr:MULTISPECIES: aminotransferase class I/II-fold pyridoxal phosphate-dependent enzyme [unclassified Rhodococcus (in: high G+C Gram-positive bacteria)]OZC86563.1 aminotransferase [Rhodococcus sp. 06-412-2C]OZD02263.1 aminotransferase [Rhodococcus sp. 06-412-2B]